MFIWTAEYRVTNQVVSIGFVDIKRKVALLYRERLKSVSVLLSITQAAPGRNTRNLGKGI